jgi:hypothetical protein
MSPAPTSARPARRCRCGRCGADYEPSVFAALAPVSTFGGDDLVDHVVHWPAGVLVDVRACARCNSPIARLTRPAS